MQAATQTWDSINTATDKWYVRFMPSLTDLAFLLPAFLLFAKMSGTKALFSDGDTGWHIRTGEWILQHRAVPTQDLFSFTKPHQAWFAWEWGWDVLFALIHKFWGLGGVGFVSILLLGLSSVLLYKLVVGASGNEVLSFAVTAFAICGTTIHWLARPHLLSWIFFLIFLHVLRDAEEGRTKALFWLPCLTVIWTNTHGSFFVGIVLVLTSALGEAIEAFCVKGQPWRVVYRTCRPYLLCAAGCLAVTLLNPYTWHLHYHIVEYLSDAKLLDNNQEYQSISFHGGSAIFFEGMLLLGGASVFWFLQLGKVSAALVILCWAHLALFSARNIPLFLMVAAPMVACLLQEVIGRLRTAPALGVVFKTISEICEEIQPLERVRRVHLVPAVMVLVMAGLFAAGARGFEGQFNADAFPIQAIPVIDASPAKRILTYDQWGDYLIYRLYPAKQVFIDGRSDFYGGEFVTAGQRILEAQYDCMKQLNHFAVDMVIVKPDAPLSTLLKGAPGWKMLFDDGKVLVFQIEPRRREASVAGRLSPRGRRVLRLSEQPGNFYGLQDKAQFGTLLYERRNS